MTEQAEIVRVGADGLDEVRRILVAANEQYRAVLAPAAFDPYLAMVLDLEPRLDVAEVLVLHHGQRAVGTVTFFPDARDEGWGGAVGTAGIRSMAVAPAARGRGIGAALVAECARRARNADAGALVLHTSEWLPAAIRLYERCGFVRDPARDLRAMDVLDIPAEVDFAVLAYLLDVAALRSVMPPT